MDAATIIALIIAAISAIAAVLVIPEARRFLGLDKSPKSPNSNNSTIDSNIKDRSDKNSNHPDPVNTAEALLIDNNSFPNPLFVFNSPMPVNYDNVKPGMPLSIVLAQYKPEVTGGSVSVTNYSFHLNDPLFRAISFDYFDYDKQDPSVPYIKLYFRSETAREYIRNQAIKAFGFDKAISRAAGRVLEWPNINSYKALIDADAYRISKSDEE